jgi:hypothetical protein
VTPKQRRSLLRYILDIAVHMGLRDWTFSLEAEPCEDAHAATIACTYGRKIASICVSQHWMTTAPEEQRHVIIHELVHVHLDSNLTLVEGSLPSQLGASAFSVFREAYRQHNEHATDAIASAIEEFIPLWEG